MLYMSVKFWQRKTRYTLLRLQRYAFFLFEAITFT